MKSLSDRVVDVLRWSEGEWLSAVDVTRRGFPRPEEQR